MNPADVEHPSYEMHEGGSHCHSVSVGRRRYGLLLTGKHVQDRCAGCSADGSRGTLLMEERSQLDCVYLVFVDVFFCNRGSAAETWLACSRDRLDT